MEIQITNQRMKFNDSSRLSDSGMVYFPNFTIYVCVEGGQKRKATNPTGSQRSSKVDDLINRLG